MGIILSKEHGLNPIMIGCQFCGESKAIALTGARGDKLKDKYGNIPRMIMTPGDLEPCDKCKEKFKSNGCITIVEVEQAEYEGEKYPRLTGRSIEVPLSNIANDAPNREEIVSAGVTLMFSEEFRKMVKED